jgi:hypothetical protein
MKRGLFVRRRFNGACWICGSAEILTREHKFKASDLRRHFGAHTMLVGVSGVEAPMRIAQGVKSRNLKFKNTICERCNSSVTQESDHAYDRFIQLLEHYGSDREAFQCAFNHPEFQIEGPLYTPLFRYFAKLIGCQLAEIDSPIPVHLSRFVAKVTDRNCIWLDMQVDPFHNELSKIHLPEPLKYAAHGGLIVMTRRPKLLPTQACSTMTIGKIQFRFWYGFTVFEVLEMRVRYPDFILQCATAARETLEGIAP